MEADPYEILEVSPRAREEVIQAAHRVLIKIHHTDSEGGDEEVAREINAARDILCDPAKRKRHDRNRNHLTGRMVGDYRVIEKIASGGVGTTYLGEHVRLGTPVCIKHCSKISPQHEEILVNETKAMWDLRHYAIPAVRDLIKLEDGSMALIMSYIPGPTLEQVIGKVGRLDPEHVAWIAERSLNALMYIHYQGVVHGDIKPQNIIILPKTHQVSLVDFGLAMIKPKVGMDAKGYTPYFASPEEVAGRVVLPESDFYSLGMTLIYALGGGTEFVASREVPEKTPPALREFIRRLIVKNPLDRPHWGKEDLCETIQKIRVEDFDRSRSNMKPIPGFD